MIYLSQLQLNPLSPRVQSELRNPYEMHRSLSRAFGDGEEAFQQARCMFRIDLERSPRVLVQSLREPLWNDLLQRASYVMQTPSIKTLEWQAAPGQCLRFRLRANPTKRVPSSREGDALAGRRVQLYQEEEQLAWMFRKGEAAGFSVQDCRVSASERQMSRKQGQTLIHQAVLFDGRLQVTDPEKFSLALANGIGSGKGFGFGLLSLARG